ncbi:MAG TPA: UvrD-helicase domain-containing protein [Thermoanaerobaculia bacterium]|nr:UvrD-helicase domain-containing protein [Thermoanaerobaculia bacterium]
MSAIPVQSSFSFGTPRRRNVVIEAGAGTGKTTAIVAEVLKLLLSDEALSPERIVLVTFTEKAAGEIADRIHQALTELALRFDAGEAATWPIDSATPLFEVPPGQRDAYRRACAAQLARIESLRSQTIHSFCQSLLRQFPIEAGLDPRFTIIEGFERSLLYGELYDAWVDDETRLHPTAEARRDWEVLLEHVGYLFLVRNIILPLVDRRDLLLDNSYDLGALDLVEHELLIAIERLRVCDADSVAGICDYLRDNASPRRGCGIDTWLEYLKPIANVIRTSDLPKGRKAEFNEAVRVLRADKDKGHSIYDRLSSHRAAVSLLAMMRRFIAFLDEEKHRRGVVDFDDLLLRTLDVLNHESVLERVRGQFDYIFVDEFQDTDRVQAKIIDRLARDRTGALVDGRTIVVGDPKQSIYGFRRADPETYDAFTRELIAAGAEHRKLLDQFRSTPPLLAAVNAIFTELFADGGRDPNVFRPEYHRLRVGGRESGVGGRSEGSGEWGVGGGRTTANDEPSRDLARGLSLGSRESGVGSRSTMEGGSGEWGVGSGSKAENDELSRDLARSLSATPLPISHTPPPPPHSPAPTPDPRPPTPASVTIIDAPFLARDDRFTAEAESIAAWIGARGGDLRGYALLFRRTTKLDDYLDVFERRGIPYVLPPTRLFLDRPAPVDLLAVLRAIAFSFDRGAEISAARTPYFALTDAEIARGVLEGDDTYRTFLETLNSLRAATLHLTVAQLIDLVIRTCGIETVYAAAADGARSLRHLEHVRAIAFGYDQRIGGSVRQFVDEISRRRGDPDEMEPSLIDEASDAVRILTVHAAKGLEFDTVILPDLEFPSKSAEIFLVDEPRSLVLGGQVQTLSGHYGRAGDVPLKEIGSKREEAENRRLFYVAVTRAKEEVVFVTNAKPRKEGFARYVEQIFDLPTAPWPPENGRVIRTMAIGGDAVPVAFERVAAEGTGTRTRRRLADTALEAELAAIPAVDPSLPAPVMLPAALPRGDVLRQRASSQKRGAGILLHRILEVWDGQSPVEPLLVSLAVEQGSDAATTALVRKRLATVAKSKTFLRIAQAETLGRELPLLTPAGERRIDRFLREGATDLVVDYKSGQPSEERVVKDREQVRQYSQAMSAITGRPCAGLLWYIDVDVDRAIEA